MGHNSASLQLFSNTAYGPPTWHILVSYLNFTYDVFIMVRLYSYGAELLY